MFSIQALLRHTFLFFFRIFIIFYRKSIDLGPWRRNIIWKWLRNDSGMFFDLLETNPEPFLDLKVHIWNIFHNINSKNTKNQCLIFKSQHLVTNPGQGPLLKCAPGQDSIKDSSIIKSYCLKSGVMDKQHLISCFAAKSGWGQILNRFAIR